ncbi:hypothetical protein ACEPAF_7429 [Sanghuangporus sanghuang]
MDNVRPDDLPTFLDPLLDYLAATLPPSIYSLLFTALSYALMAVSGLSSLVASIPSLKPWEWDAQTVLPPLIMFLTAYYTLLSLYRTTSFMVRVVFRVVKWGLILGLLGASAGWLVGDQDINNNQLGGVLGAFRDGLHGHGHREGAGAVAGVGGAGARGGARTPRQRPRMYESFAAHEQWRYNEEQGRQAGSASDAQRFVESVAGLAGRTVGGLGYDLLSNAKSFFDSMADLGATGPGEQGSASTRKQAERKASRASVRRKTASR